MQSAGRNSIVAALAAETSNLFVYGSSNLFRAINGVIQIGRGDPKIATIAPKLFLHSDEAPEAFVKYLMSKVFGAAGNVLVAYSPFPDVEDETLLRESRQEIRRVGFEFLFALLPYFLGHRKCYGEMTEEEQLSVRLRLFEDYCVISNADSLDQSHWNTKYAKPLLSKYHETRRATRSWLFRNYRVSRVINSPRFENQLTETLKYSMLHRDWLWLSQWIPQISEHYFYYAHDALDRLGMIANLRFSPVETDIASA